MGPEAQCRRRALSRRAFCRSSAVGIAAVGLGLGTPAPAGGGKKVKFFKNLACGHVAVRADQRQALDYALEYGFEGISPNIWEFAGKSAGEIGQWVALLKARGIRYGSAGLAVQYRRSEQEFRGGLRELPAQARLMQALGVGRVVTWITPGHDELTYIENFEQHKVRLREAAKVLKDYGIRLGLEFVGPRTSRARWRFAFISTQREMMDLIEAIGTGNVGLLLDSWHWYTSRGTVEELLGLSGRDVVGVHVNDAPAGIDVDKQIDNRRKLPVTTGVIDLKGFINALARIGYDGPVECEPFDRELRALPAPVVLRKTIDSLNRLWGLIAV